MRKNLVMGGGKNSVTVYKDNEYRILNCRKNSLNKKFFSGAVQMIQKHNKPYLVRDFILKP